MKHIGILLSAVLATAGAANADEVQNAMQAFASDHVATWASDPLLIAAIRAQNAETAAYEQDQIDALDALWRAQVGMGGVPLIDAVIEGPVADFLRAHVANAGGTITEAFVMDARGLNVAASDATSDYWQGDEAKFTETFAVGGDAIHLGDVELDESTQTVQSQVSMTITDPETGESIGAITIGLDIASLM